jgi:membrane-associated protease RseP (regulator of RpoE activity)
MKRYLPILSLLGLLFAAAAQADEQPKPKPVVVPFELLPSGHMTVMVKVNGKGPYRLIFDTGAPITLLNNKVAKEAGLLKGVPMPAFALFGSMGEAEVGVLEVGRQKAEKVPAIVMDHPTVDAISQAFGPIEGIVGFPFFARFKMTLDYQAKTMTFVPSGFEPPDVMRALMLAIVATAGNADPKVVAPAGQWGMVAKESGDDEGGVTIQTVLPGSPAAAAGLKTGDRLLTIDKRWTDTLRDLFAAASLVKPGATAPVTIRRDGKEMTLKVKPTVGL